MKIDLDATRELKNKYLVSVIDRLNKIELALNAIIVDEISPPSAV